MQNKRVCLYNVLFRLARFFSTQLNVIGSAQYWRSMCCQWQIMATKEPWKEMSRWQGSGLAASAPTVVLSPDLLKSPKRLSIAKVITWLSLTNISVHKTAWRLEGTEGRYTRGGDRNSWRDMWAGIDIWTLLQAALVYLFYQYPYNSVCIRLRPKRTLKTTSTCDIFLCALKDVFPVHLLHNNEWKDNCVCVCVCVELWTKRWQSPLSEHT
jgi:hypothetical protein